ncbi:extracellular solute-binding protein [Paenibacillus sp. LMG 31461]|uniref:Extracellular solute-binding protein n=1 Tax=Paenibacillus plantarum TaxID=2654975 RepID=A0ABX1XPC7_9BACL|nr:extracellular solute-binding protein [Paenibacillus plantarum]NOU69679.1 extracellular solute-binding protein [Paenibacillus plantarum]
MKQRNAFTVMLIVLLIASLVLSACSKAPAESEGAKGNNGQSSGKEPVTIKFLHWYNEETGNWNKVIKEFEKENPGIKVESMPLVDNVNATDYLKKLDLMTASGDAMDVVMFHSLGEFSKRVKIGMMEPLDEFLSKDGINVAKEYLLDPKIDGKYYGLPAKYVVSMMMLNKKHLDEAGLKVPESWTWEEYAQYAKALTKGEGAAKRYGTFLRDSYPHYAVKVSGLPEKNYIVNDDSTYNGDQPSFRESLELRNQMENIDKSAVPLSETISQKLDYRQQFFTGKASMMPAGSWMITEWGNFTPDFPIAWAPMPTSLPDSKEVYSIPQGDMIGVAKKSVNKEAAYKFVRWFTTKGLDVQGKSLSGWKQSDRVKAVDALVASTKNPNAIDKTSLLKSLDQTLASKTMIAPVYITEAEKAFVDEAQLYLLGTQDIDKTMSKIKEKITKIIASNK